MSHFTVLVIGPDHEAALAPFHEFECTGKDDKYVIDIDKTEEARKEFEKDTDRMLKGPDGELVCAYDNRFYRDPTPEESAKAAPWDKNRQVKEVPNGWEELTIPSSEHKTFAEWCDDYHGWSSVKHGEKPGEEHKHGYVQLDEKGEVAKCIDHTNPNSRWDWYQVGGRWTGYFPLKDGATGKVGEPGLGDVPPDPGTADQVRLGDVDFESARAKAEKEGRERFAKWRPLFEKHGKPELSWFEANKRIEAEIEELNEKGIREEMVPNPDPKKEDHELNREGLARNTWKRRYNEQPAIAAAQELRIWDCPVEEYGYDEEAYAQKCRDRALAPFAIVKDGKWFAKGDMGWWAAVSNKKDEDEWREEVARLYDDLPPDTMLTLVDCHT